MSVDLFPVANVEVELDGRAGKRGWSLREGKNGWTTIGWEVERFGSDVGSD